MASRPSADSAISLDFKLHPSQLEIFDNPARFKVVAAGRRFGKSYMACVTLLIEGLKEVSESGKDLSNKEVYYVAPTFEQGKKIMWPLLKSMAKLKSHGGIIEAAHENTAVLTLINGRRISIKGADRPDTLRGVGLSYAVLDEYAFMKGDVWELIISPSLADVEGGALFIGTPDGKNHFYDIWTAAKEKTRPGYMEDWEAWQFDSLRNPTLSEKELKKRIAGMSVAAARQEFGASFSSGGGATLREEWWKYGKRPVDGDYYVAIDLAGFSSAGSVRKGLLKIKDKTSMAVVKATPDGWFVEKIIAGQWDVRETALRIVKAYRDYRPVKLGIEKGALKNAIGPYLEDEMKRLNCYFLVWDLTSGSKVSKADRIRGSLQGRLEKGRILLNDEFDTLSEFGSWQRALIEEANDFPSPLAHDDMIDSLAYIDQIADVVYFDDAVIDDWVPLDLVAGI